MGKHEETLETLEALADVMQSSEETSAGFAVKVHSTLLRDAVDAINAYKYIADEFAKSIIITQGEIKPKIAVDIERFLAAQWTYNQETNAIQQGI